ncbi:resolvase [Lysinibacillus alkalisoli]|uniref:Resolvase n=1 Tax=Lysinibacillus alkalisoli TaxID=1911548 RepID=A0A917GA48_9BACI|nr:recombinase family protein [Lysinibacillus alkalisoli]GGG31802.1 resolvase [Lysinibacillus alkalisoli]
MLYGYQRPLYDDPDMLVQSDVLQKSDRIFKEMHGQAKKRHALEELLLEMKAGDILQVSRFFALADTTRHLEELLKICAYDGVTIHFIEDDMTSVELLEKPLLDVLNRFLEFQSDIIKQSTMLGMMQAKEKGKVLGRPRKADENVKRAIAMYQTGQHTLFDIKNETGISKSTLYRYLELLDD